MQTNPKFLHLCPRCGRDMLGIERFRLPLLDTAPAMVVTSNTNFLQLPKHQYRDYCSQECINSDRAEGFGIVPQKYETKSILSTEEMLTEILGQIKKALGIK